MFRTPGKSAAPLIDLRVFRTRTFSVGIAGNVLSRLGTGCVPYLMPLMLQVGLGHSALTAGMMMAPMALGSLTAKSFAVALLRRFGYRRTLMGGTVCIGLMIAQFSLQSPALPLWLLVLPMILLGMTMSVQFTAMNSITLGDLSAERRRRGQQSAGRQPATRDQFRRGERQRRVAAVQHARAGQRSGSFPRDLSHHRRGDTAGLPGLSAPAPERRQRAAP